MKKIMLLLARTFVGKIHALIIMKYMTGKLYVSGRRYGAEV